MYNDKTREPLVLLKKKAAIRFKALVTRHKSGSCHDQVRNGNRETKLKRRGRTELLVDEKLNSHNLLVIPI